METELERHLIERWKEVLRVERVERHDNFFELGGDSVRAAVFVNGLQRALGEVVSMATVFEVPTVAGLAAHLERLHPEAVARLGVQSRTLPSDGEETARRVETPAALAPEEFDEGSL